MTRAKEQTIYKSPVADVVIPEVPITEWVLQRATARASHTALVDASGSCLLYTSPSPRDRQKSRMPSSA